MVAVREQSGGRGVDAVLDSIGAEYLAQNLESLAVDGKLVVIGLMGGAKSEFALGPLLARRLSLIATIAAFEARFGAALEAGEIRPVIDRILPLAEASEAHRAVAASEHFGKVILRVA